MRIIGIDPGTRVMGWGVLESAGNRPVHIAHGLIRPPLGGTFADRLVVLDEKLAAVITEFRPNCGAVETIFFAKNAQSAAKLGHARGIVLLALRRAGLQVFEYPPAQVKRAVVGRGRANKQQVAMVISGALRLSSPPPADAADALAVALTHLNMSGFQQAIARSQRR